MINLGVAIQKSHRRDCRKMSEQLIALQDTPESLRGTIISNHAVYTRSRTTGTINWRSGWWIIWVIFMLIRVVSSNGCGESKTEYNPHIQYEYNGKSISPDSLIKMVKDSSLRLNRDPLR